MNSESMQQRSDDYTNVNDNAEGLSKQGHASPINDNRRSAAIHRNIQALADSSAQSHRVDKSVSPQLMFSNVSEGVNPMQFQVDQTQAPIQMHAKGDAQTLLNLHKRELAAAEGHFNSERDAITVDDGPAANGLKHWADETQMAAKRHYNEIRYLDDNEDSFEYLRLGRDNTTEPDLEGEHEDGSRELVEVKTTYSIDNGSINNLVKDAMEQLDNRSNTGDYLNIGLYLESAGSLWPWALGDEWGDVESASKEDFHTELARQTSIKDKSTELDVSNFHFDIYYSQGDAYKHWNVDMQNDL